jgi:hypothetical protein
MRPAEGGRQAYALARMLQRRPVRVVLAASQAVRFGWRAGREALGAAAQLIDLPGPALPARPRFPHLRVAHLSAAPLTGGLIPGSRITPSSWRTILRRDRPDLLLVDDVRGWTSADLRALLLAAPEALLATPESSEHLAALGPAASRATIISTADCQLHVDLRTTNPIGVPPSPPPTLVSTGRTAPSGVAGLPTTDDVRAALTARAGAVAVEPLDGYRSEVAHARRVLHLLAAGTPTVATPTATLRSRLTRDLEDRLLVSDAGLLERASELATDPDRDVISVQGRRHVLQHHTTSTLLDRLLGDLGYDTPRAPLVSVLLSTRRPDLVEEAIVSVGAQRHPSLELILVAHGIDQPSDRAISAAGIPCSVLQFPVERPLGAVLDAALDLARGAYVAKMDDDDLYGPDHLADLLLAIEYSGAEAVGRWCHPVYLEREDITLHDHLERQEVWATHLPGATMLVRGETLRRLRWRHVPNAVDTELVRTIVSDGGAVYSTHRFDFIRRRHGDHTYQRADRGFRRRGARRVDGLDRRVLLV